MKIKEMIEVMQHFENGGEVEIKSIMGLVWRDDRNPECFR